MSLAQLFDLSEVPELLFSRQLYLQTLTNLSFELIGVVRSLWSFILRAEWNSEIFFRSSLKGRAIVLYNFRSRPWLGAVAQRSSFPLCVYWHPGSNPVYLYMNLEIVWQHLLPESRQSPIQATK